MTEHIETNQIVICYMMDLETTWHVSPVTSRVSHVTLEPLPNGKSYFHMYSSYTMCPVSHVTYHV